MACLVACLNSFTRLIVQQLCKTFLMFYLFLRTIFNLEICQNVYVDYDTEESLLLWKSGKVLGGGSAGTRTRDHQLKRLLLYQLSY